MTLEFFAVLLVSLSLSFCLSRWRFSVFQDQPGARSLHQQATPRSGGIAICLAWSCGYLLLQNHLPVLNLPLLVALLVLVLVAVGDDLYSLAPGVRFVTQALVAILIVFAGGFVWLPVNTASSFMILGFQWLTVIAVIWSINLYNFMDGMDGFAAGMAIWGFSTFAMLAYLQGDDEFLVFNLLIVVSVYGFWLLNFPPARIFMGDTGSTTLGAMMSVASIMGIERGVFPVWVPLIVFSAFWVDATLTLLRRILKGEKFWLPHRSHYYQRLALIGLGHKKTVLWEYALMFFCCFSVVCIKVFNLRYNAAVPVFFLGLYGVIAYRLEGWLKLRGH